MDVAIRKRCDTLSIVIILLLHFMLTALLCSPVSLSAQEDPVPCRSFVDPRPRSEQTVPVLSRGRFLVAGRNMRDPRFAETVLLLVDYGPQGAMGLIINRPTDVRLSRIFPKISELKQRNDIVYVGGPVGTERVFILIRSGGMPGESLHVSDDIYVSSSERTLRQVAGTAGAGRRFRVYAGYTGWSPRQLDQEVLRGDWHVVRADARTIFDKKSSEIWPELIRQGAVLWVKDTDDFLSLISSR